MSPNLVGAVSHRGSELPDGVPGAGPAWAAVGCAVFVLLAVAGEVVSGQAANSENPSWVYGLLPLTWPEPARVAWWLLVAAAAAAHRVLLVRAGFARGRWLGWLLAAPFVVFAGGIAAGASWSTWH